MTATRTLPVAGAGAGPGCGADAGGCGAGTDCVSGRAWAVRGGAGARGTNGGVRRWGAAGCGPAGATAVRGTGTIRLWDIHSPTAASPRPAATPTSSELNQCGDVRRADRRRAI